MNTVWLNETEQDKTYNAFRWGNLKKEKIQMSLCFSMIYDDVMYVAADSRSSQVVKRNVFGNVAESVVDSDDYQKIIKFSVFEKDFVMLSTGQNKFGPDKKTLVKVVSELVNRPYTCIGEFIKSVNDSFLFYKLPEYNLEIMLLFNENNNLCYWLFDANNPQYTYKYLEKGISIPRACCIGTKWAKTVFEYNTFDEHFVSEERIVAQINAVYDKIERLSCEFDNTVGGPIRIGKLTPDGFIWLQNGYEI